MNEIVGAAGSVAELVVATVGCVSRTIADVGSGNGVVPNIADSDRKYRAIRLSHGEWNAPYEVDSYAGKPAATFATPSSATNARLRITASLTLLVTLTCALFCNTSTGGTAPLEYQTRTLSIAGYNLDARIPAGYTLELLTRELESPRMITFADNDDMFIGSGSGAVYRLAPPYTQPEVLVTLRNYPHSVAFRDREILIAQTDGVYRAAYQPGGELSETDVSLLAALPGGSGHSSRTVRIGPDGRVYASLGISGNCSDEHIGAGYNFSKQRGGVLVLDENGAKPSWKPFATGLRNPIGFDWHPASKLMYAVSHGPDHWGYELPPESFRLLEPGSFHGMPWFQYDGAEIQRDSCIRSDPPRPAGDVTAPAATFPARNGPMGLTFVPEGALDPKLVGDAVVALHGSWATQPDGSAGGDPATRRPPKVVSVRFDNGVAARVDDLISGFQLADGQRWARPAGVAIGPDGAMYFSSDGGVNGLFRLRRE